MTTVSPKVLNAQQRVLSAESETASLSTGAAFAPLSGLLSGDTEKVAGMRPVDEMLCFKVRSRRSRQTVLGFLLARVLFAVPCFLGGLVFGAVAVPGFSGCACPWGGCSA